MSSIEDTIERLAAENKPATPCPCPVSNTIGWAAIFAVTLALPFLALPPRADIAVQLRDPLFIFESLVLGLVILGAACSAVWLSFPDYRNQRWVTWLPLPLTALYLTVLGVRLFILDPNVIALDYAHGIDCCFIIVLLALLPGAVLFLMMRRYATVHPRLAGGLALMASAGIGHLALRFTEANNSAAHLLVWHIVPILLLGGIGAWLGRKILSW